MDLELKGRRALVTGATSGLGRQIALTLAGEGASLAIVGRRRERLDEVTAEAAKLGSPAITAVELEMMDDASPRRAAELAIEGLGGVDILVNSAGASSPVAWDADDETWEAKMTLNWTRQRQLTNQVLPAMRAQRWGRVINITALNESESEMNIALVAKAAVHAWSKSLSDVVAADRVTVNCIAPGRMRTDQTHRFLPTQEAIDQYAKANIPMARYGEPQDLAGLATFLASPRADYITGTVIPVDGGMRRYLY
jgi:3-oxoacyl-[acyl-carrier protein] reductase